MTTRKELSEKVETLQNLLVSYSTGGQVTDAEYKQLRTELLANPTIRDRLPDCVRTCRDLRQFWQFIQPKFPTYRERRTYLWAEFNPILDMLESESRITAPSDDHVTEIPTTIESDAIHVAHITEVSRRDILDYILSRGKPFTGRLETTEFLELVWKECGIFGMHYELERAKQDLWQHTINNYDWDDKYLLYQYFCLLECEDAQFLCFLEKCVHPVVLSKISDIQEFTKEVNNMLKYDGYILESRKKISGKPVYKAVKCQTYEYDWDVFICHASEDKERFVEALASKLRGVQVSVWYDDFSLRLGDQLKDKIEEGLARSRFGIVVLSKYFFVKKWPQDELNVLVQRDSFNRKVILPIWLDVDYNDVFTQSPLLAGHVAARAEEGLDTIVEKILTEIGSG